MHFWNNHTPKCGEHNDILCILSPTMSLIFTYINYNEASAAFGCPFARLICKLNVHCQPRLSCNEVCDYFHSESGMQQIDL